MAATASSQTELLHSNNSEIHDYSDDDGDGEVNDLHGGNILHLNDSQARVLLSIKVLLHRKSYTSIWKWRVKYIIVTDDGLLHSYSVTPISRTTQTFFTLNQLFDPKLKAPTILPLSECSLVYFREEKILLSSKYKFKILDKLSCEKLVFFVEKLEDANAFMQTFQTILSNDEIGNYKKIRKNSISHQIQAFCSVRFGQFMIMR